jgi:hypothetical protein
MWWHTIVLKEDLMKEMIYRTKVHMREEQLHRIMDAAAHILEHPEIIRWAVNSCLERARLCIETVADILNSYNMYLIKCGTKIIRALLSFTYPCLHFETAIAPQRL